MHAPKVELYNLEVMTHPVSHGSYPIERFAAGEGWLFITRPIVDRPNFLAMSSYVLPTLGIAVTRWQNRPESTHAWYDYYVDILTCEVEGTLWTIKDLYLDVVVLEHRAALTEDADEYLEAVCEGLLTQAEAEFALMAMHKMLNGLAECGYSMQVWLKREVGLEMVF